MNTAEVETAVEYFNSHKENANLEIRQLPEGNYGLYIRSSGQLKYRMSEDQVVDKAMQLRVVDWRRKYFKPGPTPDLIECTVCGEVFEGATQHMAPCVK